MRRRYLALCVGLCFATVARADGNDLACEPAEAGTVQIDGLLDDWKGVPMARVAGDPGVAIACNLEGKNLLVVVNVEDARFVRTAKNAPGEDHFELQIGGKRLVIFPGDANKIKEHVTINGAAPGKNALKIASSLQRGGWAVEMSIPLATLGMRNLSAAIPYKVTVFDCDSASALKTENTASVNGSLAFAEAAASYDAFLSERGLKPDEVWFDKPVHLAKKSEGRLVLAGRYIAIVSDGYYYRELPVSSRHDVKEVKLLDLAGDGRQSAIIRYVEHGEAGAEREVIAAFRLNGEIQRTFAAEVARSVDGSKLVSKVAWIKRGAANDLSIEAGTAVGFTPENFRDWGGEEIVSIALPWSTSDDKKQRYQFVGDEYKRSK